MTYRPCQEPPPDEADIDTPEMVEAAAAVERGERHLRMLARLAEIGMEIAEAIGENAKAALADGKPAIDPAGPFDKIARTIRRTIALEAKLAAEVKGGRAKLAGERASARSAREVDRFSDKTEAVIETLKSVHWPSEAERPEMAEMLDDAIDLLDELDEFKDFLDRPVGETVARLCEVLGLDPEICVRRGETWMVRAAPYHFENARDGRPPRPVDPRFAGSVLPP